MEEIQKGLHLSVMAGEAVPVMVGSATKDIGVLTMLHMIKKYFPSISELKPVKGMDEETELVRTYSEEEPFSAFVFKTMAEQHMGELSLFRIYSGTLKGGSDLKIVIGALMNVCISFLS